MIFDENSFIVKLYVKKIKNGDMTLDQVPNLYNLKDVVATLV